MALNEANSVRRTKLYVNIDFPHVWAINRTSYIGVVSPLAQNFTRKMGYAIGVQILVSQLCLSCPSCASLL